MMRKELKKVDEYKENMYFEAVQDILSKINDPKTKGSAKVFYGPVVLKNLLDLLYHFPRNVSTCNFLQISDIVLVMLSS
jgi:hypothetical protein